MRDYIKVCHKLIDTFGEECNPSHVNNNGYTAFMYACNCGNNKLCHKFIDTFGEECKPSHVNNEGYTAFMYACMSQMDDDIIIKMIYVFGSQCNPYQTNNDGKTAISYLRCMDSLYG